jgi:cellulose synthase/poly-beta-1,6-N-acetylglucosamine synthase-like glycosyltransferase
VNEERPFVSVIMPVHNESHRIEDLLNSLETQEYQEAEYIFIDDRSEDSSAELIGAFISRNENKKAKLISLKENPGPNYKQYALTIGIENSHGELIIFTDADCQMPPTWISGMVMRMSEKTTGAMIAPVLKQGKELFGGEKISLGMGFFHLYQRYEHGIRYIYLAGATGLGAAGGGFGNNLILRRACLDVVGGYENIPSSPTEDAALISKIRSCTKYKMRASFGKDTIVITKGEKTWKDLISQTLRWNNGGIFSPDLATRFNYNFLMITIAMGIMSIFLLPFYPRLWPLPLGVIVSMIFNTAANLMFFGSFLPKGKLAYAFVLFFTPAYFSLLTILGYLGFRPKWKGEKYKGLSGK